MTAQVQTKPVETINAGERYFYSGMTRAEAEKKDIYSCFMGLDFKDLDKNKDGILQEGEIREKKIERGTINKIGQWGGAATIAIGTVLAFTPAFALGIGLINGGLIALGGATFEERMNPNKLNEEIYDNNTAQVNEKNSNEVYMEQSAKQNKALVAQIKQQQKFIATLQKQLQCLQEQKESLMISSIQSTGNQIDHLEEITKLHKEINQLKAQLETHN